MSEYIFLRTVSVLVSPSAWLWLFPSPWQLPLLLLWPSPLLLRVGVGVGVPPPGRRFPSRPRGDASQRRSRLPAKSGWCHRYRSGNCAAQW